MEEKVLVLRCCEPDGTSHRGFRWPVSGPVECPDWNHKPVCGNGLHGWLWGAGDSSLSHYAFIDPKTLWLVVEVLKSDIVDLGGKVKFPRGNVLYCGDRETAVKMIADKAPQGIAVMFQTLIGDSRSKLTAGDYSNVISGNYSNITVGNKSYGRVGNKSKLIGGNDSFLKSGSECLIIGGQRSVLIGEYNSSFSAKWSCIETLKSGFLFADTKFKSVKFNRCDDEKLEPGVPYTVEVTNGNPQFVKIY